jgi:uncharacterized delta-60 repeat protein
MIAPASVDLRNPFPGLRPFREDEADRFFGQEDRIEDLVYRLSGQRFLAVLGLSGSGKSSLINAGLLAQLRPAELRGGRPRWRIARLNPGDEPLGNLAAAVEHCFPSLSPARGELERDTRALPRLAGRAGLDARQKILLVIDQFEELFRYQEGSRPDRKNQAAHFVQLLLEAIRAEGCPIHVLLAMRSEYLGDCATFHELAEEVNAATYLIPKMDRESAAEVIVQPVELRQAAIDPSLVQHLINESEALEDGLPLLQHGLRQLWDRWVSRGDPASPIGWADLGEERSLEAHLNRHLDSIYDGLTDAQKKTAERLLRELADRDAKGRVTRRQLEYGSLALPELDAVVAAFRDEEKGRTFLVRSGAMLDISHECLLRRWERVRKWLQAEDRDRDQLMLLARAAEEAKWPRPTAPLAGLTLETLRKWRVESAPDATRARRYSVDLAPAEAYLDWSLREAKKKTDRQRWLLIGVFAGVLLAAFLMGWLWLEERKATARADASARDAVQQRNRALEATARAEQQQKKVEQALADLGIQSGKTQAALRDAQDQRKIADRSARDAVQQSNRALVRQLASDSGLLLNSNPDGTTATLLGIESLRRSETVQGYEALWGASRGMGREVARLAHQGGVEAVAFSPDGTLVATGSRDNNARVFEARTGREVARLAYQAPVVAVAFSPDGTLVATGSYDKTARVFEARTGRELARLAHQKTVYAVAFSADGTLVSTGSADNTARVFEARTGREVARVTQQDEVVAVAFSRDGALVATGSLDTTARVFEVRTGREVARMTHPSNVFAVAFSPDGKLVATGCFDHYARVFEVSTGRVVAQLRHQSRVDKVAFSPDGKLAATGSIDDARVFEALTGREVARLAHRARVSAVSFSPDSMLVSTGSYDKTARVFEALTGREVARLGHQNAVTAVAFSPDGKLVATGSEDKTARVFEPRTDRAVIQLANQNTVYAVAFSADGTLVAMGSQDGTARVFDARTGRELARLAHRDWVWSVAFSPDGTLVGTGSRDNTATVFEWRTRREVARLVHQGPVSAVDFSADGTLVATGSYDKTARVFEARTGHQLAQLAGQAAVYAVAFSPDGTLVATGSYKTARVFEWRTAREVARLEHQDQVRAVAFSPDGTLVATGSYDKIARVFEARTGREVARLAHQNIVDAVAFSPDGTLVATGSEDWTARVFEARTGREVARLALGQPVRRVDFLSGGHFLGAVSGDADLLITQDLVRASDLISDACSKLDRNLTREEWANFLGGLPYRETCEHLNPASQSK